MPDNKPDIFCYICGENTIVFNSNVVTSLIKLLTILALMLNLMTRIKLGHHRYESHALSICTSQSKGKKSCLKFGIPIVWRSHTTDCYACATDLTEINRKKRSSLKYPDLESARCPGAHCAEVPPFFLCREGLGVLDRCCSASA